MHEWLQEKKHTVARHLIKIKNLFPYHKNKPWLNAPYCCKVALVFVYKIQEEKRGDGRKGEVEKVDQLIKREIHVC